MQSNQDSKSPFCPYHLNQLQGKDGCPICKRNYEKQMELLKPVKRGWG